MSWTPRFLTACLLVLCACSLPGGAALQSEVLAAADDEDAPFAVYPVTRSSVEGFAAWPRFSGYTSWVGATRGPITPVITAGDELDLTIWDNEDNSLLIGPGLKVVDLTGITVGPDGTIFMPYLDKINVAGQTPDVARKEIQFRLEEIIPSAQVQLRHNPGIRSSVSVVGGVASPGTFPLENRNISVLNLISEGGGVPPSLRNPQVKLVRGGRSYQASLSRLYDDPALDVVLQGGDKIIIEQDERYFQALGATGKEDLIYFTKDRIDALEAVSLVGGILDLPADPKGVLILRRYETSAVRPGGGGPSRTDVVFTIDLTKADGLFSAKRFYIEPEDVVLVTESPVTKAQTIFRLVGSAFGVANSASNLSN